MGWSIFLGGLKIVSEVVKDYMWKLGGLIKYWYVLYTISPLAVPV